MSTYLQLVDECLAYGFNASQWRARFETWVNEGQQMAMRRWGGIEGSDTLATDTTQYQATGFAGDYSILAIQSIHNEQGSSLVRIDEKTLLSYGTGTGQPDYYAVSTQTSDDDITLAFYPTPNTAYDLTIRFRRGATTMSDDSDTPEIPSAYHHVLVDWGLHKGFGATDDQARADYFGKRFYDQVNRLMIDYGRRAQDGNLQIQGSM